MTRPLVGLWERAEERLAGNPDLLKRLRARYPTRHELWSIMFGAMYLQHAETGRMEMMQTMAEQDLDRKERGEAPLSAVPWTVLPEELPTIVDRVIDRMLEETLGMRLPGDVEAKLIRRWAVHEATGEWVDDDEEA